MPKIVIEHLIRKAEAPGHTRQATAPMCREVVAAATRLRHTGVMHVQIGMVEHTSLKKTAMPVNAPVMLQQIAKFWQLHCSSFIKKYKPHILDDMKDQLV
jgi:hypothetical protein